MTDTTPLKVSSADLLALFGLQVGTGILAGILEAVLPFESPTSSWIGVVATMTGAMVFGMLKGRKEPERLTASYRRSLSIRVTLIQTVLGLLFLGVALPSSPQLMAFGVWILIVIPVAAGACYLLTSFGLGMGVKQAMTMKEPKKS